MTSSGTGTVLLNPPLNVLGFPNLAHPEDDHWSREVRPRHELLDALAADAEACANLGRAHQVVHDGNHSHHATCRLTRWQAYWETSRVTIPCEQPELRKRCTGECRQFLPLDAFSPNARSSDGRSYRCRDCEAARARQRRAADPEVKRREGQRKAIAELAARGLKRCANPDCLLVLPLQAFYRDSRKSDGRYSYCRQCCVKIDAARRPKVGLPPPSDTYGAAHSRMGPVSHLACRDCGNAAQEWAYDHGDPDELMDERGLPYSLDPSHYRPMCRHCHRKFDSANRRRLRIAAGWRPVEPKVVINDCVVCGKPFQAERKRVQSCSPPCESELRSRRQVERQERARAGRTSGALIRGDVARELAALAGLGAR